MLAEKLASSVGNASNPVYIEDVFSTYLYTGNGSTQTITNGIDLSGKGGLVWMKNRTTAGDHHVLTDTVTGATKQLASNLTDAQYTYTGFGVTAYNSTGFTVTDNSSGSYYVNGPSTQNYASWTFRKQPKFFDVVTYTGNGTSGRTIAHSLGSTPGCIIVKCLDDPMDWAVYHRSIGNTKYLRLNTTAAETTLGVWNNTTPTSTEFTVNNSGMVNGNGFTYVAYLFAHDAGGFGLTGTDNVITCGSFTTDVNGLASATLGYEPQFVLFKQTSGASSWFIEDNMRGMPTAGQPVAYLIPNSSGAEGSTTGYVSPTSTGFAFDGGAFGISNASYIYIAIRRGPMKVPTDATKVFNSSFYNGSTSPPSWYSGFVTDFNIWKDRTGGSSNVNTRLTSQRVTQMNTTGAEQAATNATFDYMTGSGSSSGTLNTTIVSWMFRRAPSYCDVVCYTGTGVARTVTHNLGAIPELMIVKKRNSTGYWNTYHKDVGNTKYFAINDFWAPNTDSTYWNDTSPTSSVFTVGTADETNGSGSTFVAYLFSTCAGVSKVGSYTGTGTTKQIDCGFTSGARFVLIRRVDAGGDGSSNWYVWDSARGIVSGNDPYLLLNSTAAEVTNTDYIDTYSAGFEISSTAPASINASGGIFIFLAIA